MKTKSKPTQPGLNYLCVLAFLQGLPVFVQEEIEETDPELFKLYSDLYKEIASYAATTRKVKKKYTMLAAKKIGLFAEKVEWMNRQVDMRILIAFIPELLEKYKVVVPSKIYELMACISNRLDYLENPVMLNSDPDKINFLPSDFDKPTETTFYSVAIDDAMKVWKGIVV